MRPIGRDRELAQLAEWAASGLAGHGGGMVVSGDAGIGKTTVVGAFAADLAEAGVRTTIGHCVNLEGSPLPYLPFVEAFGRMRTAYPELVQAMLAREPGLTRLLAQPGQVGDVADAAVRMDLFAAVSGGLEWLAAEQGLLLQIEDVHWADRSSLDLISYLFTRGFSGPVLLAVTYRSDDLHRRHPLRSVLSQWTRLSVQRMELTRLSDGAVAELVRALDRGPDDAEAVQGVVSRAAGNAFFAEELATAAADAAGRLPGDLADLLLFRLQSLSEDARTTVRTASVAGRRVRHDVLAAVLELGPVGSGSVAGSRDRGVREAIDAQLLLADGDGYTFRHALLAEAVSADLLPGERVRLHAAYLQVMLEQRAGPDAELARHALAAGDDVVALDASVRAAQHALAVGGPDEALAHYEVALELLGKAPELAADHDEIGLVVQAGAAAVAAGLAQRAMALVRDRLDRLPGSAAPLDRVRVLESLAATVIQGDYDDPLPYISEALALVSDEPSPLRARVLATYARSLAGRGRDADVLRWADQARLLADELGLTTLSAEVSTLIARIRHWTGEWEASVRALEEVAATARRTDDPAEIRARYLLGMLSYERGDVAGSVPGFQAAAERARALGRPWAPYGVDGRGMAGVALYELGDWDGVLALTSTEGESPPGLAAAMLRAVAMGVHAGRGDPSVPADERLVREWRRGDGVIAVLAAAAAIDAHGDAGRQDEAVDTYVEATEFLVQAWFDPDFPARTRFAALLVGQLATAAARGDSGDHVALLERGAAVVATGERAFAVGDERRPQGPESRAWRARLVAEHRRLRWLARSEPPGDDLVVAWRGAVEAFTTYPHRFELARSRTRLAAALRAVGALTEAEAVATLARETAVALRAAPLLAEIDDLGFRTRVDLLTPREAEVLGLVAEGLSNAEIGRQLFISTKTASVHVSNILAKLTAKGRTEAVAIARRKGLLA